MSIQNFEPFVKEEGFFWIPVDGEERYVKLGIINEFEVHGETFCVHEFYQKKKGYASQLIYTVSHKATGYGVKTTELKGYDAFEVQENVTKFLLSVEKERLLELIKKVPTINDL